MLLKEREAIVTGGLDGIRKDRRRSNHFVVAAPEGRQFKRIDHREDIAATVIWAPSDQANALTATTVGIDDGVSRCARFR